MPENFSMPVCSGNVCSLCAVQTSRRQSIWATDVLATQVGLLGDALFEDRRMADCGKMWQWRGGIHPGHRFVGAILYDF